MASQAQALQANRGGKRAKKMKNHSAIVDDILVIKDKDQEYANVIRELGGCRFELECYDGKMRTGLMRGKNTRGFAKKTNMTAKGDIVLVGLREFEKDKCDIISKYSYDQVKKLIREGELPASSRPANAAIEEDETGFEFETI